MYQNQYEIQGGDVVVQVKSLAHALSVLNDLDFHGLKKTDVTLTRLEGEARQSVAFLSRGYHKGIPLDDDPIEALDRLITPLLRDALALSPTVKPWQMRRVDWMAITTVGSLAYGAVPGLKPQRVDRDSAQEPSNYVGRRLHDALRYGHNGPSYRTGHNDINSRHEIHVAYALAEGKSVPEAVIADMLQEIGEASRDLAWGRALGERPFLRGRLTADQLDKLIFKVEKQAGRLITEQNLDRYIEVIRPCGVDPTYDQIDDALFAAGLLPPLPAIVPRAQTDIVAPRNANAIILEAMLVQSLRAAEEKRLHERLSNGEISQRYFLQHMAYAPLARHGMQESANRTVTALETRNIAELLGRFDGPDDERNTISRRFAQERYGLDLRRLKAADRTATIFRFCGMGPAEQAAWTAAAAVARDARIAAQDEARARERATSMAEYKQVRDEHGNVTSWKAFIDQRISEGFDQIKRYKQGATTRSYLSNAAGQGTLLNRNDGSLNYAEIAVKDRQAATARQAEVASPEPVATDVEAGAADESAEQPRREAQRG